MISSGIWQTADGTYLTDATIWIGADAGSPGSPSTNCNDWQSTAGTGQIGITTTADPTWFNDSIAYDCSEALSVVCVQR